MTEKRPRIVFMGTPEFAVASLRALKENGMGIAAVVTVADKPAGRGQKVTMSPVKQYALAEKMTLLQPEKLKDPDFIEALKSTQADIFVVVAFRMLPREVWSIPRLGTFNLHASLLPQYRGAAPINHAVINGEKRTGVTTFLIDNEIDTGKILLAQDTEIDPDETAGHLHDRLMAMGAELVLRTVRGLADSSIHPVPQEMLPDTILKKAPKIFPADTVIDWRQHAQTVHNKIRGLSPYPGAMAKLTDGEKKMIIKLFESRMADGPEGDPGTIIIKNNIRLFITCSDGCVEITSLQAEGRKRMAAADFLRGFEMKGWEICLE